MPLPPESDSQNGSGTGQIWVTSSRPISSGGSSRPDGEAWPIWAAIQWISAAIAANSGATGASSETASAIRYTVPVPSRKAGMSNPSPGPGSTLAARAGSAMNDSARDMTIRTVAAVFCASERSSARVSAHWRAPAATRIRSGTSGSAPATQAATARRS